MKSLAEITNEFLKECAEESAAAAVKTQPAAVQKANPHIPLQAAAAPAPAPIECKAPAPVAAPAPVGPKAAPAPATPKAAAPAPVIELKTAAPAPKAGPVITDEQLRALSRKHLLMMIRDLEIELAQAKKERDSLLIAYEAGRVEKTQTAQVA